MTSKKVCSDKLEPTRLRKFGFLSYISLKATLSSPTMCLRGEYCFTARGCFPGLETVHLNKDSLFNAPQIKDSSKH